MAPLQKRALFTLIIGLIFAIALIAVFLLEGDVTAFNRDETFRWSLCSIDRSTFDVPDINRFNPS